MLNDLIAGHLPTSWNSTVAAQPHVSDLSWFEHAPLVLHVSLRDLAPEVLLASTNLVDDVEHCLKANTSPHLVEQMTGSRDFLLGTLADVMTGRVTVPEGRPVVFSPFGLGVLDQPGGRIAEDPQLVQRGREPGPLRDQHVECGRDALQR